MKNPEISVLMPVYNGEEYLQEAIDSILNQTFKNFELLIINDGSTDFSEKIILSYNNPKIIYLKNDENLGLITTLNIGIGLAKGKYIARMDQDDISIPNRLEIQLKIFEKHNCNVTSSSYKTINEKSEKIGFHLGAKGESDDVLFMSLLVCPIAHPTVMAETLIMKKYLYINKPKNLHAEDYDLWTRMLSENIQFYLSNKPLIFYRRSSSNTTVKYRELSIINQIQIAQKIQKKILDSNLSESNMLFFISADKRDISIKDLKELIRLPAMFRKRNRVLNSLTYYWFLYRVTVAIFKCNLNMFRKIYVALIFPEILLGSALFLFSCSKTKIANYFE